MKLGWYKEAPATSAPHVPVDQRDLDTEIELGLSEEEALEEAKRCMSCGMCMDCETCWMYCTNKLLRQAAQGRALQDQAGSLQRVQEVRRRVPLRLHR